MSKKWAWSVAVLAALAVGVYALGLSVRQALGLETRLAVPAEVDLGILKRGANFEAAIPIHNLTGAPVRLTNIRPSCGCMGVLRRTADGLVPLEAAVLAPGEGLEMIVRLRAYAGLDRIFLHRITLETDLPGQEEVRVAIKAQVELGMYPQPQAINWGTIAPGQEAESVIRLVDLRTDAARGAPHVLVDHPAVTVAEVREVDPASDASLPREARVYQVRIRLKATSEPCDLRGTVAVEGDSAERLCEVPLMGAVEPPARVVPAAVAWPLATGSDPFIARFVCRSREPCTFAIGSVPKGFRAEVQDMLLLVRCDSAVAPLAGTYTIALEARTQRGDVHPVAASVVVRPPDPRADMP